MYNEEENKQPWTYPNQGNTPPPFTPAPTPKKRGITGKVIALALVCSLFGGVLGAAGGILTTRYFGNPRSEQSTTTMLEGQRESTVIDIQKIDTGKQMTAAEVYAANVASTVGITTSVTTNFWGYQTTSAASGSGFIISEDGYILTNYHVIEDSNTITVSFFNGQSAKAELIGFDESNDIAVLKTDVQDLTPVILGDSDNINVGDPVIAIGNPLGELTFSLTAGTVSALDREVTTSTGVTMRLLQTDCAINSGNSGGALFNLYGEVIGITNAKYSGSSNSGATIDNIGFAIPVNRIQTIVTSIIEKGYFSKPYVGISVIDVSEETQSYGLPQGAAVKSVAQDSPAEKAGVQTNDIITHVDGTAVTGSSDLVERISTCQVGQSLVLTVYRQGSSLELTVTVGEQIQSMQQPQQQQQSSQMFPFFGFDNFGS